MKRNLVCLLVLTLGSSAAASAGDWPTYLGDNGRTGATAEQPALPLRQAWLFSSAAVPRRTWTEAVGRIIEGKEMGDRVRFDDALQVAVVGPRVYFGSSVDHQVRCLDLQTGKEIWHFFTDAPIRLAPSVAAGRVYVGSDDGYTYCLDAESGNLVWKQRLGPADEWILARGEMISRWPVRTSVLVDEGVAYFGAGIFPHENVYLGAARAADGTLLWRNDNLSHLDAGRNDLSPQGYLLATEDVLYVPLGDRVPRPSVAPPGNSSAGDGRVKPRQHGYRRNGRVDCRRAAAVVLARHALGPGGRRVLRHGRPRVAADQAEGVYGGVQRARQDRERVARSQPQAADRRRPSRPDAGADGRTAEASARDRRCGSRLAEAVCGGRQLDRRGRLRVRRRAGKRHRLRDRGGPGSLEGQRRGPGPRTRHRFGQPPGEHHGGQGLLFRQHACSQRIGRRIGQRAGHGQSVPGGPMDRRVPACRRRDSAGHGGETRILPGRGQPTGTARVSSWHGAAS